MLEKWLWSCRIHANALGCKIDLDLLKRCAPPLEEQKSIREDIKNGAIALSNKNVIRPSASTKGQQGNAGEEASEVPKTKQGKPFTRKQSRVAPVPIELDEGE
ncbi:hypothetical protein [Pseudoxanthomonas mexicana]